MKNIVKYYFECIHTRTNNYPWIGYVNRFSDVDKERIYTSLSILNSLQRRMICEFLFVLYTNISPKSELSLTKISKNRKLIMVSSYLMCVDKYFKYLN